MPIRPRDPLHPHPLCTQQSPERTISVRARQRIEPPEPAAMPVSPPVPAQAAEPAYEVGKNKPPVHTRWKPGQSGNPSGRNGKEKKPPKTANMIGEEILSEMMPVRSATGDQQMNSVQLAFNKLRERVAKGDLRAIKYVIDFWQTLHAPASGSIAAGAAGDGGTCFTSGEQAMIDELLGDLGLVAPGAGEPGVTSTGVAVDEGGNDELEA